MRACDVCADHLPYPPKPILRAGVTAKILAIRGAASQLIFMQGIPEPNCSEGKLEMAEKDSLPFATKVREARTLT